MSYDLEDAERDVTFGPPPPAPGADGMRDHYSLLMQRAQAEALIDIARSVRQIAEEVRGR